MSRLSGVPGCAWRGTGDEGALLIVEDGGKDTVSTECMHSMYVHMDVRISLDSIGYPVGWEGKAGIDKHLGEGVSFDSFRETRGEVSDENYVHAGHATPTSSKARLASLL